MDDSKRRVEVCFSPFSFPLFFDNNSIVVVIDVLRATSAICTAFHYGAHQVIPIASIEEARQYKANGYLTAAERQGEVVEGFELGNSPFSYMNEQIKGKTIAITTTNGTQAIQVSKNAYKVVLGSFLNLELLCDFLQTENKNVILLCAGWKEKFNLEDTLFAGAVVEKLLVSEKFVTSCDSAIASTHLYELAKPDLLKFLDNSSHRIRLKNLNLEQDVLYCLSLNLAPVIPILDRDKLIKLT